MKKILLFLLGCTSLFSFENLNELNFDNKIENKKAIIDFYAVWCPACKALNKNLKMYRHLKDSDITIYKLDIDKYPKIAAKYKVSNLPTLLYFQDSQVIKRLEGIQSVSKLKENERKIFK